MEQEIKPSTEVVIKDQTEQVKVLANRVRQFQLILTNHEKAFSTLDDETTKQQYLSELRPLVKDYEKIVLKTKTTLEDHFKWEKKENSSINFSFRKLHKIMSRIHKEVLNAKGY